MTFRGRIVSSREYLNGNLSREPNSADRSRDSARTSADTNEPAVILELKAHGVPTDLSLEAARAWYDAAHDATYRLFLDATAQAVQEKIWKLR